MASFTVTADVADFTGGAQPPRLAYATFARATIDASTLEIITTAPVSVPLTSTPATVTLTTGVAYRVRLFGVASMTDAFYASATADCSLAALFHDHQVDPTTLQPLPSFPTLAQTIAELRAASTVIDRADGTASIG